MCAARPASSPFRPEAPKIIRTIGSLVILQTDVHSPYLVPPDGDHRSITDDDVVSGGKRIGVVDGPLEDGTVNGAVETGISARGDGYLVPTLETVEAAHVETLVTAHTNQQ